VISYYSVPLWILSILGFLMASTIVYLAIPMIHFAAVHIGLFAKLNLSTAHTNPTPVFGDVAICAGFILSTITFSGPYTDFKFVYIVSGLIIIFIVGMKR
jgi:UDP-N-acetylmuramyl pentapeptide phosphotransferase/UDP-N-acetylglucosamine-1-phosphate transferase